ncbi:MAG: hypothetical protein B6D46_16035 [Polyangiaceae bacterium UTPRO1]|jgi:hypothetical protein|nr:hypothetical protein [Myxococcales bacterium]OQY64967.1 MAG: hypothetical protein B6D46_16035 [Polyangiaceae bacterium UTPRO1]
MTDKRFDLETIVQELRQQRDEIRVRLHLARADARDEFERLEKQWEHARAKLGVIGEEAGKAAGEVGAALRLALEELRQGYRKVRDLL